MGTWLGSGAVSQQKWWSCWVGGDEESWDLGAGTLRRKALCLSEGCDERQKVGEDPGWKEKELTREAMSLATLEGNLEGTAGLSNTGEERCLYGPCLGGKHPWRLSGRWRYRLRSLVEKPSQGQSWDV